MFVLVLAVPALLVVLLGYVVGHGIWSWSAGLLDPATRTAPTPGAETAGWITGVLLLLGLVCATGRRRRRRPQDGPSG